MNIRNRTLLVALLGLGIAAVAPVAHAQMGTSVADPIRVQIGGFFPTDSTVTSVLRRTALYGGISYDFMGGKGVNPTTEGVYVDASYNSGGGNHATIVGVGVQARVNASTAGASALGGGNLYFGAGIGLYFINTNFVGSSNFQEFGGRVFIGYELPQGFFLEGGFHVHHFGARRESQRLHGLDRQKVLSELRPFLRLLGRGFFAPNRLAKRCG